jgi:hypothetical protein
MATVGEIDRAFSPRISYLLLTLGDAQGWYDGAPLALGRAGHGLGPGLGGEAWGTQHYNNPRSTRY